MTNESSNSSSNSLAILGRTVDDPAIETLHRFQALEPGYYWTAIKPVERVADVDDTLLLLDVIEFENRPHSVQLRYHPRYGKGTHTLMVEAFLDAFMPCQDAEAVRQREQQAVLEEVNALQQELMRTQTSQQLMMEAVREDVEAELKKQESEQERANERTVRQTRERETDLRKVHRRAARRSEAKGNPLVAPRAALASDVGALIGAGVNEAGVSEMRKLAIQQAAIATVQAAWLKEKTGAIAKTLEKLAPYIEERSAVALARSSGAIKLAKRIQSGIESLDLYTGKGVDVYDVRQGKDAPTSEPLTLIQGKRYMDEELAAWADVDESFDWSDRSTFFKHLAENDALLNQVLPAPRCVVSMAVTASRRHYDNPWQAMQMDLLNQLVFLLVRNGDNVHVVYSSSPSHEAASRLFPTDEELGSHFEGIDGERISIRDVEFGEATKEFGDMALHYRRFLILLCGLDHRLQLFGTFYPPEKQATFMSLDFQQRYFRFVADQESGALLAWKELPSLSTWIRERNCVTQSGSRVFLLKSAEMRGNAPELKRRYSLRASERQFLAPMVALKEGARLYVGLETTEQYGGSTPDVKCYLTEPESALSPWWLCVDSATLAEVRAFRLSRRCRSMGIGFLRLFRRLEAYLEVEAAAEKDARAYLLEAAVTHGGMEPAAAQEALDTAVRNWRASRRGAALPGIESKAQLNELLELMVPKGQLPGSVGQKLDDYIAKNGLTPLLVTRSGKAKLMLYVEADAADKAPYPDVLTWGWVKRITLEPGKTKMLEGSSNLVWLQEVLPAAEVVVRRHPELDAWLHKNGEPMSLRRYAQVLPALEAAKAWDETLRGGRGAGLSSELFEAVAGAIDRIYYASRHSRTIETVRIAIPMAAHSTDGRKLCVTYAYELAERVVAYYGTPEQSERVSQRYLRRFTSSSAANGRRRLAEDVCWKLCVADVNENAIVRHDEPQKDWVPGAAGYPQWSRHECKKNDTRLGKRKKGDGKPNTTDYTVDLSFDRALRELKGRPAALMSRNFYKRRLERARNEMRWQWDADEAQRKAKFTAAMAARFKHPYKSAVSPLFWSVERDIPVANAVLRAPLLRDKAKLADG